MMLLLLAASLVGIGSSVYKPANVETQPQQQQPQPQPPQPQQLAQKAKVVTGKVTFVTIYESSAGKACIAVVQLPSDKANNLRIEPGTAIELLAPNESFCTLFGLSRIGQTQIFFIAQKITASSLPPAVRADLMLPDSWSSFMGCLRYIHR